MGAKLPIQIPADFATATVEELQKVRQDANTAAKPLRVKGLDKLDDAERETFRGLADAAVQAKAEIDRRENEAAKDTAADQEFAAIDAELNPPAKPAEPTAAPADPAFAPAEPVATPTAKSVAAAGGTGASATGTALLEREDKTRFGAFTYAPKLVRGSDGASYHEFTGRTQLGQAMLKQLATYTGLNQSYMREPLAEFRREFPEHYRGPATGRGDEAHEFALVENAVEKYLAEIAAGTAAGNQTAAAGYCAPSLTLYDLCELETDSGILPITEIQISRGGIFFTTGPDFAAIFNGAGYWNYTEAQIIANTLKPCMEIECPSFTEQRLRNLGVCITAGILQRRGYPELISRFIRGAMIAHLHRINAFVIAQMAAGSTLVDLDPIPAGSLVGDATASGLLAAAEMVGVDMRYRNRMNPNANLETVFPIWGMAQLRADVSRRTGVDMISVSDSVIMGWFRDRNLILRLVYDWQDAYSGVVGGPGTALPGITSFPATIEFMIYPPGTWVKGVDDTIRLETVYDSTKLSTNQYTALFTEEGVLIAKVCPDSRRVVYPLCPTGATTELVTRSCA